MGTSQGTSCPVKTSKDKSLSTYTILIGDEFGHALFQHVHICFIPTFTSTTSSRKFCFFSCMRILCLKVCKDVENGSKKVHLNYFIVLYCNFELEWTLCVRTEKYSYSRRVNPSIVLWVRAFLRDWPQAVCVNSVKSNELILNTGAPQGCVLSPILFSIYINEIMSNTTTLTLIKFADDMALVARLKDEQSLSSYFNFMLKNQRTFY